MGKADVRAVSGASDAAAVPVGPFAVLTLPVGGRPNGVAVGPLGLRVHVANNVLGTINVIDSGTNTLTTSFGPVHNPIGVQVTPDNSRLYISNSASDSVSVIDRDTFSAVHETRVGKNPFTLRISPGGERVYVTNRGSDTVSVIDTGTARVVATVNGLTAPVGVAITRDGKRLYVTNSGAGTVSVIDTETRQITGTVPVGTTPWGLSVAPDGRLVYVANNGSDSVSVIDTQLLAVAATLTVGRQPLAVSVTPNGLSAYVSNNGAGTVSVIQTLNAMSPNRGPMSGGTLVTITGTNLAGASAVRFGDTAATILANTANQILVASPPGSGTGQVTVTTTGGTSNPKPFFYYPNGFVDAIEPDAGPVAGHNTVTIRGENLGTAGQIYFGTVPAIPVVVSDAQVTVSVPASITGVGVVPVEVRTAGGIADGRRAYTYVPLPALSGMTRTSGSLYGGNTVTVTGSHLATTQSVTLGGLTARFSIGSDTAIAVVIPTGAALGPVDLTVTTSGGTATLPGAYTYI